MCDSVQMVQLPILEECKKGFREHMADSKWVFECEKVTAVEVEAAPHASSPLEISSTVQTTARSGVVFSQKAWDAAIARL
jgi:hypothetical protein